MRTDSWPVSVVVTTSDQTTHFGPDMPNASLDELSAHPLLSESANKLRWANRHLAALIHNIDQATIFADPDSLAVLRADLDTETGYHVFRIASLPDLSELEFLVTHSITDVANPLRAALDKLAWQCACWFVKGTPKDVPGVKFPIASGTQEWIKAGRARNQFDPAHSGFIERFQPYHGRAGRSDNYSGPYIHQLALLQDLTNDDKHRDTHPVFLIPNRYHLRNFNVAMRSLKIGNTSVPVPDEDFPGIGKTMELGAEVLRARLINAEPEIQDAGRVAPTISLPEGRHAASTMRRLYGFVHLILSEFARDFPASLYT